MKVSFSSAQKDDPKVENGVRIKYAPARRQRVTTRLLWWLILLLVAVPFLLLIWNIFISWFFTSSAGAVTMESYPVRAPYDGYVASVLCGSGAEVSADAPVIVMKRTVPQERLDQIALMKAERASLALAGRPVSLPARRVSTRTADETIAYLAKEAAAMRELMGKGAATRAEVNQAEQQLRAAKADRERLLESVQPAPAAADTVSARLAYYDNGIRYLEGLSSASNDICAPRAGRVQTVNAVTGQKVKMDDELMWLADPATAKIVVYIAPRDFEKVRAGSSVRIVIPGSGRKLDGTVDELPVQAQNIPGGLGDSIVAGRRSVQVTVSTKEPLLPEELVNGLPVRVDWGIRFFR